MAENDAGLKSFLFGGNKRVIPALLFVFSAGPLILALISEYFFGLHPCVLCIYQRIVYGVIIFFSIVGFFLVNKKNIRKILLILCGLTFLAGAGIAFFHVGVEHKWWEGTDHCGTGEMPGTIEELRKHLMEAPLSRCDQAEFIFLGLSMAGWNVLYSSAMALFCFISYRKIHAAGR